MSCYLGNMYDIMLEQVKMISKQNFRRARSQTGNPDSAVEQPKHDDGVEIELLNQNNDADVLCKIDDNNNIILAQNVKEWRTVLKAVDAVLFVMTILGITGYFLGILVTYDLL